MSWNFYHFWLDSLRLACWIRQILLESHLAVEKNRMSRLSRVEFSEDLFPFLFPSGKQRISVVVSKISAIIRATIRSLLYIKKSLLWAKLYLKKKIFFFLREEISIYSSFFAEIFKFIYVFKKKRKIFLSFTMKTSKIGELNARNASMNSSLNDGSEAISKYEIPAWVGRPPNGCHLDVIKGDQLIQVFFTYLSNHEGRQLPYCFR